MLLRSSSTPVLGSLLSKCMSENPLEIPSGIPKHPSASSSPSLHHNYTKLSCKPSASQNFSPSLCNSSPVSPSIQPEFPSKTLFAAGFRRAQSEGNLKGFDSDRVDELSFSKPSKNFAPRPRNPTLEAIPSFSSCNSGSRYEDEGSDEDLAVEIEINDSFEDSERRVSVGFGGDERCNNGYGNVGLEEGREEMYLARGLGVCDGRFILKGGGGGRDGDGEVEGEDGQGSHGIERHYKRLLEENPCNPLYLRNYASFLYQKRRNLEAAEDYYSRAILEDPKDGEVLSEYANLVWDLYRDKDRATSYFERAIQASTENSHVHAAFARFLWETEEEDTDNAPHDARFSAVVIQEGVAA